MRRGLRWIPGLLFGLGVIWQAVAAPPASLWQQAEQARLGRHWRSAYSRYHQLFTQGDARPAISQRLAETAMVRGDWSSAETWLRHTLQLPLTPAERDAAWLGFGWSRARQGDAAGAEQAWGQISPAGAAPANLLRVDQRLAAGDIAGATRLLNTIETLPPDFAALAILLRAELSLLDAPELVAPFLDSTASEPLWSYLRSDPGQFQQIAAALVAAAPLDADTRTLALARIWRDTDLPAAALVLYAQIPPASPLFLVAAQEQVRLLWTTAGPLEARRELAERLTHFPDSPELLRLKALLAASAGDTDEASTALALAIGSREPASDDYVTAAALALANRDFDGARRAYVQAEAVAPISGTYTLQAAQFYATTPLLMCSEGRSAARAALPTSMASAARLAVADLALRCDDPTEALSATAPLALTLATDPGWQTLHGLALWRAGFPKAGRWYLEQAADAAPASTWRRRAETLLGPPHGS